MGFSRLRLLAPEKIFVILVAVFGMALLILMPPFQIADEYEHFYRAYHVSEGHWMAERHNGGFGGMLPERVVTTAQSVSSNLPFYPKNRQNMALLWQSLTVPFDDQKRVFVSYATVAKYSPVPYFPQAIGIAVGRLVGASSLGLMYFGRLFNLLFFAIAGYFSIRITPIHKWVFLLLALTPIILSSAASNSGDCLTNSVAFLFIAIALRCALGEAETVSRFDIVSLFTLGALLSLGKPPYQSVILLFFLIPMRKFAHWKKYVATFGSLFLFCLILSAGVVYAIRDLKDIVYTPDIATPRDQLAFLAQNPLMFVAAFFYGWAQDGLNVIHQLIGRLGWLDTKLPGFLIDSYLGMLVLVAVVNGNQAIKLVRSQRLLIFLTALFNIVTISFLLYIHWSALGATAVRGWTGRYLIPISPLLFLVFYNRRFCLSDRKLALLTICYYLFAGTITLLAIRHRYYP